MITLCIGRMGEGKSTLAYFIANRFPTRVIYDPRMQFNTTSDVLPEPSLLYDMLDDRSEIIIQPRGNVQQLFEDTSQAIVDWMDENPEEPLVFLADEARLIQLVDGEGKFPAFDWILRSSGREKINVVITAHRPTDIPVNIRAIAHYWCIFPTTQEHDLKTIAERCGEDVAEAVSTLKRFESGGAEVIVWDDGYATWKKHSDPKLWYVSLSQTRKQSEVNYSV